MAGYIGPVIPNAPYIILCDRRDGFEYYVPDVPRFTPDNRATATAVLRTMNYDYKNWSRWIRIMRERLNELCRYVGEFTSSANLRSELSSERPRSISRPSWHSRSDVFSDVFSDAGR